jgi:hypothetical protein
MIKPKYKIDDVVVFDDYQWKIIEAFLGEEEAGSDKQIWFYHIKRIQVTEHYSEGVDQTEEAYYALVIESNIELIIK